MYRKTRPTRTSHGGAGASLVIFLASVLGSVYRVQGYRVNGRIIIFMEVRHFDFPQEYAQSIQ